MTLSEVLKLEPFSLSDSAKEKLLTPLVHEMARWHYKNSFEFKRICKTYEFNVHSNFLISNLPFLPVSLFKKFDLLSVPKKDIIRTLFSSSTSGHPSKIYLDRTTSNNQIVALQRILMNFFGNVRRHFIIFDSEETVKSADGTLTSRNTAIRGLLGLAKKIDFILDKDLNFDFQKIEKIFSGIKKNDYVCFFGFTWLVYNLFRDYQGDESLRVLFRKLKSSDKFFLHIGGWKKLQDLEISGDQFNKMIGGVVGVPTSRVVDFYGMTEQLGTVYLDCREGFKHVPIYSDLIIRDMESTLPSSLGETGLMQFISPIPKSYPGISILSEDIGRIIGVDNCGCKRLGKYFVFEKRADFAEVRGCGDTIKI